MLSKTAKTAPNSPGVYLFKAKAGTVLYIGKAKNLRARVKSYFSKEVPEQTRQMLSQAQSIDYIITDNESEALLLESQLIKKHFPKYNVMLKDNEKFTYIVITDEKFPRMLLARRNRGGKIKAKGKIYGPFTSGSAHVLVASTLRKAFGLRICSTFPKKACLQYHLGFCTAPCVGFVNQEQYAKQVQKLRSILSGGKKLGKILKQMEKEMKKASKQKRFEQALELKKSILSLSSLLERQKIEGPGKGDEDFICIVKHKGKCYSQVFRQSEGVIRDRKKYEFEPISDALSEFLPRFYEAGKIPSRIYLENEPESKNALEKYLEKKKGGKVKIIAPKKGDKKKLLDLLYKNIMLEIGGKADPALIELQHKLALPAIPRIMECFDVSNLFGSSIVGSMVQFLNARPNKSNYRRFKIRTVEGQDDFASMKEIVFRRYARLKGDKAQMPDLVLIDGGTAQLNAALSALQELNLSIPCVSLAKEFEEIYHPEKEKPVRLPRSSSALKVLQFARDEAHRFCISYHRLLRKKRMEKDGQ